MTTIIQIGNSTNQIVIKSAIYECKWKISRGRNYSIVIAFIINDINTFGFVIHQYGQDTPLLMDQLYNLICNRSLEELYDLEYTPSSFVDVYTKANTHRVTLINNQQMMIITLNQQIMDNFIEAASFIYWRQRMKKIIPSINV